MRYYSSTATVMALTAPYNEIATTIVVDTVLGLPAQTPFTLVLDVGLSTEEIVTVTGVSGTSLTVTRGEDGSTAIAHTAGAVVRHMMTARDLRDPAAHVGATANVHGIGATASVVGTDTTQTLTNKTVNFADNTVTGVPQASVTDLVDDLTAIESGLDAHEALVAILSTSLVRRYATPAARDAEIVSPVEGMVAMTGTGATLTEWTYRSGTWQNTSIPGAWTSYDPGLGSSGVQPVLGTGGSQAGWWTQIGAGLVIGQASGVWGTGATLGTGFYVINLPTPAATHGAAALRVGQITIVDVSTGAMVLCDLVLISATQAKFTYSTGTTTAAQDVTSSIPWAPATGDTYFARFTYEK